MILKDDFRRIHDLVKEAFEKEFLDGKDADASDKQILAKDAWDFIALRVINQTMLSVEYRLHMPMLSKAIKHCKL